MKNDPTVKIEQPEIVDTEGLEGLVGKVNELEPIATGQGAVFTGNPASGAPSVLDNEIEKANKAK